MSNCCVKLGLLNQIGPMIDGLHSENDRIVVTCAIMALLKYFSNNIDDISTCLNNVSISGKTITFTRKNGDTIDIVLPINEDEHVTSGSVLGNSLVLKRRVGLDIVIDLSSIIYTGSELDTSGFFHSCTYDPITKTIKFFNTSNVKIGDLDATPFLLDKYLSNIELVDNGLLVKFTWNSESGKLPFYLNLSNFLISDTYIESGQIEGLNNNRPYIQLEYNTNRPAITIDLYGLYSNIINQFPFIPGYYKSKQRLATNGTFDLTNTEYLGTTWDPSSLAPTYDYKYIYKVVSKTNYELVAAYKIPKPGYYYVLATGLSYFKYNKYTLGESGFKELTRIIPGGVVGIIAENNGTLEIQRLPYYFIYLEPDVNNEENISSVTFNDIKSDDETYVITSRNLLGQVATANECMFYPSRYIDPQTLNFAGKSDWIAEGEHGANAQAALFNRLLADCGYKRIFEIKREQNVDDVNIMDNQDYNVDVVNGDKLEGLRFTDTRAMILKEYIGKAKRVGDVYLAAGTWVTNNLLTDNLFSFVDRKNWRDKTTLEYIWAYIMSNYFNSTDPDSSIASVSYSDNTGWYTTWANLSIINKGYGFVINANTECRDGTVNDIPPQLPIPNNVSDTNLPCSSFTMTFDIQANTVSINGTITLNIGGRKWDSTGTPYRYVAHGRHNNENVAINKVFLLYRAYLKDCDFIMRYKQDDDLEHQIQYNNIISERITYNSNTDTLVSTMLSAIPNNALYITELHLND